MKVFLQVGKTAVAVFWLLVLANLISPLNKPVDLLLNLLGALVLLAHVVELGLFGNRLRGLPNLNLHRLQVLLFGIFHLYGLAEPVPLAAVEPGPDGASEPATNTVVEPVAESVPEAPAEAASAANDDTQVQHA